MDAVNQTWTEAALSAEPPAISPPMPTESPLAMPEQKLSSFKAKTERRKPIRRFGTQWLSRLITFGGGLAITCWGGYQMYRVIDVGGISTLKWTLLVLFLANFSWIALAFAAGVVGFFHLLIGRPKSPAAPTDLASRTAVCPRLGRRLGITNRQLS